MMNYLRMGALSKKVGVVTQAMHSPLNNHTVAIARLPVDCANNDTKLIVHCATHGEIAATSHSMPFHDVEKKRRTAICGYEQRAESGIHKAVRGEFA